MAQLIFTAITVGADILEVSRTPPPTVLDRSPSDQTDCKARIPVHRLASSRNSQHTLGCIQSIAAKFTFLDVHPELFTSAVCCLQAAQLILVSGHVCDCNVKCLEKSSVSRVCAVVGWVIMRPSSNSSPDGVM